MQRRSFLASSIAASALAVNASPHHLLGSPGAAAGESREYYELRRYHLRRGPQVKLVHDFFREALVPALNRLGISPVGVFEVEIGPESPGVYVLIPSVSLEILLSLESRLYRDADYLKAGAAFLNAPAEQPAYVRMESSLMVAFEGMPRLRVLQATGEHRSRMFELRTYESPSDQDHVRKVEMFNSGEFDVFEKAGFWQIFYGDTLIGSRLPNLTYMLGFEDLADRTTKWNAFRSAPEWKKLSTSPRYAFEEIVSNITNIVLSPAPFSQI
ncbi:MAG: NIPSNAP family protein [Terriglobia bacterium]